MSDTHVRTDTASVKALVEEAERLEDAVEYERSGGAIIDLLNQIREHHIGLARTLSAVVGERDEAVDTLEKWIADEQKAAIKTAELAQQIIRYIAPKFGPGMTFIQPDHDWIRQSIARSFRALTAERDALAAIVEKVSDYRAALLVHDSLGSDWHKIVSGIIADIDALDDTREAALAAKDTEEAARKEAGGVIRSSHEIEVLRVVGYDERSVCHKCIDQRGQERRIDLHVGKDSDSQSDLPLGDALVGSTVRISGSQAYEEIAIWPVEIVAPEDTPND